MNKTILPQEAYVPPQKSDDSPEPKSTTHDFEPVGIIINRMMISLARQGNMLGDDRMDKDQGT